MENDRSKPLDSKREQFEKEKLTRRSALRKAGVTSLLSVFSLVAADDVARLVLAKLQDNALTHGIADGLARDFRSAGVALADTTNYCDGVIQAPCYDDGPCPGGVGPCKDCNSSVDCEECQSAATWKSCNCQQAAANAFPACCDCNGVPLGYPWCVTYNLMIGNCGAQYLQDSENCG
jgi:hypothetical protein